MLAAWWVLWLVAGALAQPGIPKEEHRARRAELRKALPEGLVALFGATDKRGPDDGFVPFRQNPNFLYLTGWEEPGAILLLWPPDGEALLVPPRNEKAERYTGRKMSAEDANARQVSGFDEVLATPSFEARRQKLLEGHSKLYTPDDARQAITKLRLRKSPHEVELIQKALEVSGAAHRAAWRRVRAGVFEFQVAASFTGTLLERGCRDAYTPMAASGPNAMILHYWKNSRRLEAGELLVLDAGAECSAYAADITRTLPVSGRFSARQRELYEIVLGAERAIIAAVKPGATQGPERTTPNSLYKVAFDYIDSHGKDRAGNSLGKYLVHGVSHHVGLQVQDSVSARELLEPGMVITVEPGIYIPEEGIAIRIEDMVLVTERGAKVMSAALPKEAAAIEKALAR
jgi:Xaa-Pro aminopeptidase